jgi:uncharacterized protein involved in type VI secretion and phage assembly
MSLFDVLQPNDRGDCAFPGVATAIVTNNNDPEKTGRVRVRFLWLSDTIETWWARVATPMAGADRGLYALPEVDDEVLVAFEQGDPSRPIVIGSLWNGKDKAPEKNDDGKNNMRTIKSRSGHIVRLDDTDGAEKIEIVDKTGDNKITIDSKANKIEITAKTDIAITSSDGKVTLSGAKGVDIASAQAAVKIEAKTTLDLQATAAANVKGKPLNLN